ncbi:MAG TPA: NIPSNAP family protein, partial [Burkholderiales bacterium]
MLRRNVLASILVVVVFAAGYIAGNINSLQSVAYAQSQTRVFELRTYTAHDGKLENVLNRFRDHTMKMFARHGMVNVGYWTPEDAPLAKNTLIYILAHPSRE